MAQGGARPNRGPLIVASVVGVALIVLVRVLSGDVDDGASSGTTAEPTLSVDPSCTQLQIVASSEKAALLREIAAEWNGTEVDGTCAQVQVESKSSGGAAEALARGWDEAVDGPRPDVWSPAASSWTVLVRQRTSIEDKPDLIGSEPPPSIANSPLVIAMPKPMAESLGWPEAELGWQDVYDLARDPRGWAAKGQSFGTFALGKTNPNFSTSGLNATIGTYVAATGTSSDLTAAELAKPEVQAYARAVESAVVHYGDTTLTFLSNLQKADDRGAGLGYISAVAVEEKSVWDYNQGNPTGDPATLGDRPPPRVPLVAIYPKEGTLSSDNPYAVLQAPWVSEAQRAVAAQFLDHVRSDDAQQRFADAAFRTFDGKAVAKTTLANGLIPDRPTTVLSPPAPAVLAQVQELWNAQRKAARVLLVIDTSGSMGASAGQEGKTKLELAQSAAIAALEEFGPSDDVALWSFSTESAPGAKPYRELLPFTPIAQARPLLEREISGLFPQGGTALYATARAAFASMSTDRSTDTIKAVVLLTDGRNEYPPDTDLPSLERQLAPEDTRSSVRFFPIGYGRDADLPTLERIAESARGAAYDASDPASIDKVFTAVLSNF